MWITQSFHCLKVRIINFRNFFFFSDSLCVIRFLSPKYDYFHNKYSDFFRAISCRTTYFSLKLVFGEIFYIYQNMTLKIIFTSYCIQFFISYSEKSWGIKESFWDNVLKNRWLQSDARKYKIILFFFLFLKQWLYLSQLNKFVQPL